MKILDRPKIVVLGMISKTPVGGMIWMTMQYLIGLKRLGFDPYYVEAHGGNPSMLMSDDDDDASLRAAILINGVMSRFGMERQWAFHALHSDGRCYGMSERELRNLYGSAELILNLHGATIPSAEQAAGGRLIYVGTDPGGIEVGLAAGIQSAVDLLEPHAAFFTFAENYGNPDCLLPVSNRFQFRHTRQPVVLDLWRSERPAGIAFTTVSHWKQQWKQVHFEGDLYHWSKHEGFLKFVCLPSLTNQVVELALSNCSEDDRRMLQQRGWRIRDALGFSLDLDSYRDYIFGSAGEFTAAKDQYVRLRTGWFSERSAMYLAAARPVVTEDTGFGRVLPAGRGLYAVHDAEEAAEAIGQIAANPRLHRTAAREVAEEFFDSSAVLPQLLKACGVTSLATGHATNHRTRPVSGAFPPEMILTPLSRRPNRLLDSTMNALLQRPIPGNGAMQVTADEATGPEASIVVVTYGNLALTRACLESVLLNTDAPPFEIVVVDNGSNDGTADYLHTLQQLHANVRLILNRENRGFAPACNQGLEAAVGDLLVLLNNDTIVTDGWLSRLGRHARAPRVGLVGAVTNRIGGEAQVATHYCTYGELLKEARRRAASYDGRAFDIPTITMFCLAMRRSVYQILGPIDEQFQVGMLEDDDYSERARSAGFQLRCAEDVLVHHFGESSFGNLVSNGEYNRILASNTARFIQKWGKPPADYGRHANTADEDALSRMRRAVEARVPAGATILVASRGDPRLLELPGYDAWHFPRAADGSFAGHYPKDSADAIRHVEELRCLGGQFLVFPQSALWWLDYYTDLKQHLAKRHRHVAASTDDCVLFELTNSG